MIAHRASARRVLAVVAFLAAAVVARPATAAAPSPLHDPWTRVASPNLVVLTNGDASLAIAMARRIERLREAYPAMTAELERESTLPTVVLLFRDSPSFAAYRARYQGEVRQDAGVFVQTPLANYLVVDGSTPMDVALHEYTHLLVSLSVPRPSVWLNEGLAEFYSTFESKAKTAQIGRPIPIHVARLAKEGLLPTLELRRVTGDHPIYHSGDRRWMVYAESWALVHFLQFGVPEGRPKFRRMLERLSRGEAEAAALAAEYPDLTPTALDAKLRTYLVANLTLPYVDFEFTRPFDAIPCDAAPAELGEVAEALGHYVIAQGDSANANRHFLDAQTMDATAAVALAGRGAMAEARGDTAAANAFYERSLARGATPVDDRRRRLSIARSLLRRGSAGAMRARQLLDPLMEGDEPPIDVLALYGHSFVAGGGDADQAMGTLMMAQSSAPHRMDVVADLVVLNARSGRLPAATHLYRTRLRHSGQPEYERPAIEALAAGTWEIIARLAQSGSVDEADSLRTAFMTSMSGVELPESVDRWQDDLALLVVNASVKEFNQRRYARAVALLDRADALVKRSNLRGDIRTRRARYVLAHRLEGVQRLMSGGQWRAAKASIDSLRNETMDAEERSTVDAVAREVDRRVSARKR